MLHPFRRWGLRRSSPLLSSAGLQEKSIHCHLTEEVSKWDRTYLRIFVKLNFTFMDLAAKGFLRTAASFENNGLFGESSDDDALGVRWVTDVFTSSG
jgi:hypothetical protein